MVDVQKSKAGTTGRGSGEGVSDRARDLGQDIKSQASEFADSVSQVVKDQASGISSAAKEMTSDATERLKSAVNEQKSASADYLGSVAHAVERAAEGFERDVPQAAKYIRQAADRIDSVADAVRQRDLQQLVGEVEQFARRQPTLFFGGAVILGFAALRFFKSASTGARSPSERGYPGAYVPTGQSQRSFGSGSHTSSSDGSRSPAVPPGGSGVQGSQSNQTNTSFPRS